MNKCQFPICEFAPTGPFACGKDAPETRGEFQFCPEHAIEYDKDKEREAIERRKPLSLEGLVDKLEELAKKRGQYAGNVEYYQVTIEMHGVERAIKKAVSKIIGGK